MFPIEKMCQVLRVSRSGYYAWNKQQRNTERSKNADCLKQAIQQMYDTSKRTYGSPCVASALQQHGWSISRASVGRIMRQLRLRSRVRRKFVGTTQSRHNLPVAQNLLDRNFHVTRLAQTWVSDITYVKVNKQWAYLTAILDLADRRVIGWKLSKSLDAFSTVIPAWKQAIQKHKYANIPFRPRNPIRK